MHPQTHDVGAVGVAQRSNRAQRPCGRADVVEVFADVAGLGIRDLPRKHETHPLPDAAVDVGGVGFADPEVRQRAGRTVAAPYCRHCRRVQHHHVDRRPVVSGDDRLSLALGTKRAAGGRSHFDRRSLGRIRALIDLGDGVQPLRRGSDRVGSIGGDDAAGDDRAFDRDRDAAALDVLQVPDPDEPAAGAVDAVQRRGERRVGKQVDQQGRRGPGPITRGRELCDVDADRPGPDLATLDGLQVPRALEAPRRTGPALAPGRRRPTGRSRRTGAARRHEHVEVEGGSPWSMFGGRGCRSRGSGERSDEVDSPGRTSLSR